MCPVLLPSLLTFLRTEKATNPDDAKALMLGASAGAAVCPILGSDAGVLSHLPCWAIALGNTKWYHLALGDILCGSQVRALDQLGHEKSNK